VSSVNAPKSIIFVFLMMVRSSTSVSLLSDEVPWNQRSVDWIALRLRDRNRLALDRAVEHESSEGRMRPLLDGHSVHDWIDELDGRVPPRPSVSLPRDQTPAGLTER
jgi:hypothetical protein